MSTLRALAFSAVILSAVAACAAPPIPEQIAGSPPAADVN
jgi:hypothetical protein